MAQQINHDVVDQSQSMGDSSLVDVNANQTISSIAGHGNPSLDTQTSGTSESSDSQVNIVPSESLHGPSTEPRLNGIVPHKIRRMEADNIPQPDIPNAGQTNITKPIEQNILANGDTGEALNVDEVAAHPNALDASGGSDTDTSKADSTEQREQGALGHVRSNSVKKPLSFKTVSVTKNFLAKSAVVGQAAKTGGDKSSQVGALSESRQQTPRPRLVAKSGGGLRDSLPKTNKTNGKGPDPAQVWNKNRRPNDVSATPPPAPKQFTDEELKQQYGIHMATRLQADENSKESKWADIDDDEDDWAPETVEWIDGTKSMLVPAENQATPAEESTPVAALQEPTKEPSKPTDASAQRSSLTGTAKTILKPGGGNQQKAGLVLKGIPEAKPSLVAKPTASAPQKSPWAQLPPIDKVSPVQINPQPPPQPQPSRFQQTNPHGFESIPLQPSPAREIAADDFDRSWRENERGHRELYDSKSGKYEPVPEGRRGSIRHEQGFRQPAVLQRPSQPGNASPAEPSPAFQTSRSSAQVDGMTWGRRRTSSTVSGGSGQIGRRMSMSRPQDFPPAIDDARQSPSVNGIENAVAGRQRMGGGQWTQHSSPAIEKASLSSPSVSIASPEEEKTSQAAMPVSPPGENMAELQKRVMREKRELARKRREEEEAKLEAEKRERLQRKLESLGPAPEKKRSQEQAQDKPQQPSVGASETAIVTQPDRTTIATTSTIAPSPPKPPLPASSGEITQYGSMKVHPPQPLINRTTSRDERLPPKPSPDHTSQPQLPPSSQQLLPSSQLLSPSTPLPPQPASTSSSNFSEINLHPPPVPDSSRRPQFVDFDKSRFAQPSPRERHQVSWSPAQSTRASHSVWSPSNMPTVAPRAEVWGAPTQGRALGNGTFDNGFQNNHARPFTQYPATNQQHGPGPIGPPNRASPPASGMPASQVFEQQPNTLHRVPQSNSIAQSNGAMSQPASVSTPGPIAPPKVQSSITDDDDDFQELPPEVVENMYFLDREKYEDKVKRRKWLEMRKNGTLPGRPAIKETFVQRSSGKKSTTIDHARSQGGAPASAKSDEATAAPAPVKSNKPTVAAQQKGLRMEREASPPPEVSTAPPAFTGQLPKPLPGLGPKVSMPSTSPTFAAEQAIQQMPQQLIGNTRMSRFFPSMVLDDAPAPDSIDHPAYDGDIKKPRVNLPKTIVVKLPPTKAPEPAPTKEQAAPAVQMPVHMPPAGAVALVDTTDWQDRINKLCGNKQTTTTSPQPANTSSAQPVALPSARPAVTPSAQRASVVAPDASTKEPLSQMNQQRAVSISLPGVEPVSSTVNDKSAVTSKSPVDNLMEEREFGSLPTVQIPKTTGAVQVEDPKPMNLLSLWRNTKVNQPRAVDPESVGMQILHAVEKQIYDAKLGLVLYVKLPGDEKSTPVLWRDGTLKRVEKPEDLKPTTLVYGKPKVAPRGAGGAKGSSKTPTAQRKSQWARPPKATPRN
ncbi:hypothetical protein EV356DRAFT_562800 [Viridothelium virens]|uniref:Uncharacterized protein n=1 Tax=Viridothelium virens TaxID=1048519 RepID=A0A6A6HPN2_VIRVR|nr:hypothetical protein EV356DRAFT_562800 [Viridothelium virens]